MLNCQNMYTQNMYLLNRRTQNAYLTKSAHLKRIP